MLQDAVQIFQIMKDSPPNDTPRPTRIQSVARAARALLIVTDAAAGCSATEVATRLGLAVPTTFHILNTLVDEGLLTKAKRRYFLGPAAGRIADGFMGPEPMTTTLLAALHQLAEATLETGYLAMWRHGQVVVVGSVEGQQAVNVAGMGVGLAEDAHARASGKMLLSTLEDAALDAYLATHPLRAVTTHTITDESALRQELRRTRQRGYSIDQEEFRDGVSCIGVPIEDAKKVYATYTLSVPVDRLRRNRGRYLVCLRQAAAQAVAGLAASNDNADGV
jgi:DNA-binding IclR family transcriptional regulator